MARSRVADEYDGAGRGEPDVLELRGIRREFGDVAAVDGVDLSIGAGEFVTLLGPSGCGKTTLLRIVAGFERPDEGTVRIAQRDVLDLPPERRPVNLVFQRYALFPHLNVRQNVAFGLEAVGVPRGEVTERVRECLASVRLDGFDERPVTQLSGGQQQRVALARAIVKRPQILLLDEPLSSLDLRLRREMQLELRSLHRELGLTFIYVTHDQEEALTLSDRIVVMRAGKVEQAGSPQDVYQRPATRFVAEFIGETNLLEGRVVGDHIELTGTDARIPIVGGGPGGLVAVSVRPEMIALTSPDTGFLAGVLEDSIFTGSAITHRVRLGQGTDVSVLASPREPVPSRGARVGLRWDAAEAVVVAA